MDIVAAYANAGIDLIPSGERWRACCPFHGEKTPSFMVYPDGSYHCFGCGAHGSFTDLVSDSSLQYDCSTINTSFEPLIEAFLLKIEKEMQKELEKEEVDVRMTMYDSFDRLLLAARIEPFVEEAYPANLYKYIFSGVKKLHEQRKTSDRCGQDGNAEEK